MGVSSGFFLDMIGSPVMCLWLDSWRVLNTLLFICRWVHDFISWFASVTEKFMLFLLSVCVYTNLKCVQAVWIVLDFDVYILKKKNSIKFRIDLIGFLNRDYLLHVNFLKKAYFHAMKLLLIHLSAEARVFNAEIYICH